MFGKRRRRSGAFFKQAGEARRAIEDEQPWFLAEDDGPELDVEAGRSARTERPEDGTGR